MKAEDRSTLTISLIALAAVVLGLLIGRLMAPQATELVGLVSELIASQTRFYALAAGSVILAAVLIPLTTVVTLVAADRSIRKEVLRDLPGSKTLAAPSHDPAVGRRLADGEPHDVARCADRCTDPPVPARLPADAAAPHKP